MLAAAHPASGGALWQTPTQPVIGSCDDSPHLPPSASGMYNFASVSSSSLRTTVTATARYTGRFEGIEVLKYIEGNEGGLGGWGRPTLARRTGPHAKG